MTSFISFGPHCIFSCIGRGEEAHLNVERGTWASTTVSQSVYIVLEHLCFPSQVKWEVWDAVKASWGTAESISRELFILAARRFKRCYYYYYDYCCCFYCSWWCWCRDHLMVIFNMHRRTANVTVILFWFTSSCWKSDKTNSSVCNRYYIIDISRKI